MLAKGEPGGEDETGKGARRGAPFLILAWAGLAGASGVALAAAAAHKIENPALVAAATILMVHAAAASAIVAVGMRAPYAPYWSAAAALMLGAASLFSGEVALHSFTGTHIFPFAAPTGGSLLILSWLIVAGLAIAVGLRGAER